MKEINCGGYTDIARDKFQYFYLGFSGLLCLLDFYCRNRRWTRKKLCNFYIRLSWLSCHVMSLSKRASWLYILSRILRSGFVCNYSCADWSPCYGGELTRNFYTPVCVQQLDCELRRITEWYTSTQFWVVRFDKFQKQFSHNYQACTTFHLKIFNKVQFLKKK